MKRRLDRYTTFAAYVLLVVTVIWSSWSAKVAIDRLEELQCATAETIVASGLFNLALYGNQSGVDRDAYDEAQSTFIEIGAAVEKRCGLTFLDDIEF